MEERKHFTQSAIARLGTEYVRQVVQGQITFDEALAEVRASVKIDQETKTALLRDIRNKWVEYRSYNIEKVNIANIEVPE